MSRTFKIFDFELTSDVKIQPAFICREGKKLERKFLQRLETCLLIAEADRVLCHLVMF